jgi:hypothetical protein
MERTLQEFVEDMVLEGRTPQQVFAVAMSTRWANVAHKARRTAAHLERRLRKSPKKR